MLTASAAAVLLCLSCPHINSSIYSRSLPVLSLSVSYWKKGSSSGRRTLNAQLCLGGRGGNKQAWEKRKEEKESAIDRCTNTSRRLFPSPLSPLSLCAKRQQMTGIWREGGCSAKRVGLCSGHWPQSPVKAQGAGRSDGDGGEGTGMTSPQDPLDPLPLYCKQREQESLPPLLV